MDNYDMYEYTSYYKEYYSKSNIYVDTSCGCRWGLAFMELLRKIGGASLG